MHLFALQINYNHYLRELEPINGNIPGRSLVPQCPITYHPTGFLCRVRSLFLNHCLFYNRGQFLLRNLNRGLPKTIISYSSPRILQVPSPSPLPLYNVDLGNADCRETVRDPPNNIDLGGGGRGKYGRSIVYLSKRLEGYVFLTRFVHDCVSQFFHFLRTQKV